MIIFILFIFGIICGIGTVGNGGVNIPIFDIGVVDDFVGVPNIGVGVLLRWIKLYELHMVGGVDKPLLLAIGVGIECVVDGVDTFVDAGDTGVFGILLLLLYGCGE